jgi:Ca-activated chloride channel family protein
MSSPAYAPKLAAGRASSTESRVRKAAPAAEMVAQSIAPNDSVLYQGYHDEGRDKFENIKENPNKITKEEPVSTFSVDVDTASYSFVRGELNRGELPQKDAVRVEEMINYFDYDYALPASKDEPFQPNVAVYPTPWNANTKIMQIGVKGYDIKSTEKPRANLTFLIDVSGSMNEPNKLPLLKQSMRMLVNELKSDDSVALVVYAGSAGTALEPTKVKNKQDILNAIDKLEAGGSTAGGEGINLAYKLAEQNFDKQGVNRVILATDGDFNVGITDPEELKSLIVKKRDTGVTLSVLGFGEGNYNDELMQKLAQNGNGNASYIDTVNEARKVLVNEAGSTLFTIAKDVKIQVEFNPSAVSEYRLIGYTTRILNREDFNNDKVDAGDIGAGHKVTALYEITPKGAKGSVDPLRYGAAPEEEAKPAATSNGEYAFLKIRCVPIAFFLKPVLPMGKDYKSFFL